MPSIVAVDLDLISESQSGKAATANNALEALSSSALFGVKSLTGLELVLYGGNMIVAGTPTPIATQTLTLDDDDEVYVYSTDAGVFTKTTTMPTGWPAISSPADAIALYRFVTADGFVTDDYDVFVPSLGVPGTAGVAGEDGPAGTDLAATRKRLWAFVGSGSTSTALMGANAPTSPGGVARTLSTASYRESIPYVAFVSSASAGSSAQVYSAQTFCFRGNASGRGGFTLSMRICLESTSSPANHRSLFGLFAPVTIGNVEPDTLVECIGIGSKAGDANLSVIHNDASGTATMVALGSNFPARATDNVYEITFTADAFASTVDYHIMDAETGNEATGVLSTNLPTNTTFLSWVVWVNNGSTASATVVGMMQVVGETRW